MNNWSILRYSSIVHTILCKVCRSSECNNLRKDQWKRVQGNCPFLPTAPYFSPPYSQFQTNPNMIPFQHHVILEATHTPDEIWRQDHSCLIPNPCSDNNSPSLSASSVPLCLTPHLIFTYLRQRGRESLSLAWLFPPGVRERRRRRSLARCREDTS